MLYTYTDEDTITIKDLEIYGHHGLLKEENVLGQKFLVSLTLFTDLRRAGIEDDLAYSIDYAELSHFVESQMKKKNFKLIESLAEYLAEAILLSYGQISKVIIEIKKPWAPILLPLDTVSVKICRGWHEVYLGVGSNLGDREEYIKTSVGALSEDELIKDIVLTRRIETKPYGKNDQPDFLNAAIHLFTLYTPREILSKLHEIEDKCGRKRTVRWGPRTLDLDILFYDDMVMDTKELTIPHRELHKRGFVLKPLMDLAPFKVHPVLKKTVTEMYDSLSPYEKKWRFSP